jgi:hypothetical protein
MSTTSRFTYRLSEMSGQSTVPSALESLRGAGKQVFAAFGGGEAFLRQERDEFGNK